VEIDLSSLRLGPEKEEEVREALQPLVRELEVDLHFPRCMDISEAFMEMLVVVEEIPLRLKVPFNLKTIIGEFNETQSRKQGVPAPDVTAHRPEEG
jgi:hypothetical protein